MATPSSINFSNIYGYGNGIPVPKQTRRIDVARALNQPSTTGTTSTGISNAHNAPFEIPGVIPNSTPTVNPAPPRTPTFSDSQNPALIPPAYALPKPPAPMNLPLLPTTPTDNHNLPDDPSNHYADVRGGVSLVRPFELPTTPIIKPINPPIGLLETGAGGIMTTPPPTPQPFVLPQPKTYADVPIGTPVSGTGITRTPTTTVLTKPTSYADIPIGVPFSGSSIRRI